MYSGLLPCWKAPVDLEDCLCALQLNDEAREGALVCLPGSKLIPSQRAASEIQVFEVKLNSMMYIWIYEDEQLNKTFVQMYDKCRLAWVSSIQKGKIWKCDTTVMTLQVHDGNVGFKFTLK